MYLYTSQLSTLGARLQNLEPLYFTWIRKDEQDS